MKSIIPETEHGIVHRFEDESVFNYCGWPTVCCDKRGVLYAVSSGMRMTHIDPSGKNCMWMSFDGGKTWTNTIVMQDSHFDDRDSGIISYGDGKMVFSAFSMYYDDLDAPGGLLEQDWFGATFKEVARGMNNSWKTLSPEQLAHGNHSFVMRSDDYGVTWSKPITVPLSGPHGPSACKDGRLIYMGKGFDYGWDNKKPIVLYTSLDDGKTWEFTGEVPVPEEITVDIMYEPHAVELPNGRLLGAIRVHNRPQPLDPLNTVYITFSDDKGKTWSTPKSLDIDGLPPHLLVHSSGAVILSYSCRTWGRWAQKAIVSYDNGETWTEDYTLDTDVMNCKQKDMGYASTAELPDGSLITVYYQALPDDWHTSVLYTKWKLDNK